MILEWSDYESQSAFDTQVLVIGTGAGGAAAGTELAEAGFEVTFLEEGSYIPTSSFNPYTAESVPRLYRDAGATLIAGKPPFPYVEGRCVGGSTVINGGMAYRTSDEILETWARLTGDPGLGPKGLEALFERVEAAVHAKPQRPESIGDDNRIMAQGAAKQGWTYEFSSRNQDDCVGSNNCVLGCVTGAKQSTLVSYMPRARAAGARVLTDVRVDRLLIEGGRCVGASGRTVDPYTRRPGRRVSVRAQVVIVACGAVQTPYLLLNHKLGRASGQLGKNFLCHPNVKLVALYPFDVHGHRGVSQGGQVRHFHKEGIILAENMIPPGAVGAHLPVAGAEAWELMRRYNQMIISGVLVEDSSSGTVKRGFGGMANVRYEITRHDHERFLKGVRLLSELHFGMGADRVVLPFVGHHFARSMDEVNRAIAQTTDRRDLELFTPHLMGTARMGATAQDSVIDLDGQLWDLPGCYVADASVFPTACGVNPQITIMALATRVAHRLADRLRPARAA